MSNKFPSWGETGELPTAGFFYEGGDQVNEKHLDALWHNVEQQTAQLITGMTERVSELSGDRILDSGMVVSTTANTREINVSASSAGAYVDGQQTGSTTSTTLTLTANGGSTTRTDSIWVDTAGQIGKTEGTASVADDRHKLAEVDVDSNDTITAVRNYGQDAISTYASENNRTGDSGDLWLDKTNNRLKVYQNGAFRKLLSDTDTISITGGDGLKGGSASLSLDGGSTTLNIEPADFAGAGLSDDGSDNLTINAGSHLSISSDTLNVSDDWVDINGDTMQGDINMSSVHDITQTRVIDFADRDSDGVFWRMFEDQNNGHFNWLASGVGLAMDLEHNGELRIAGTLTENASL